MVVVWQRPWLWQCGIGGWGGSRSNCGGGGGGGNSADDGGGA